MMSRLGIFGNFWRVHNVKYKGIDYDPREYTAWDDQRELPALPSDEDPLGDYPGHHSQEGMWHHIQTALIGLAKRIDEMSKKVGE